MMADHVHMMIAVPPNYAVSHVARTYGERKRNFVGQRVRARGYFRIDGGQR